MENEAQKKICLERLNRFCEKTSIAIKPENRVKLIDYIFILLQWNRTYNLTAIHKAEEILTRHIFDSLIIVPFVKGPHVLDVGSGAGLPGIPLALALPDYSFILLDSNRKKTLFLHHVAITLQLNNVKTVTARIESFNFEGCFATIVTRATSSLREIVDATRHLYCVDGEFLAMKGRYPMAELTDIQEKYEVHPLQVPELNEERHLICIKEIARERKSAT